MDDNYYVIEHGLLKNIGSSIKKGVSKLKGSQKKNHKYLRRELMPNGRYKYTYAEDVSDTNKYVYNTAGSNDNIKQWSINKKGAETGEYSYKKGTVKSKHVTVEKKYYSTDKKIKGKKYTYKELTPKGWRYYYENADETKKNLDRAIAMAKQEKNSSEKSLSKARDAERMAYSNEYQLSNHGPASGMNDKIKEKLQEAIAKLETKNDGASSAEKKSSRHEKYLHFCAQDSIRPICYQRRN